MLQMKSIKIINLESHLDSLHMIGGNCVRNTMSDRDPGNKRAFALTVYIFYFTGSGKGEPDLTGNAVTFEIEWIPVESAEWSNPATIVGGGWSEIESTFPGSSFAVLKKTGILSAELFLKHEQPGG